MDSASFQKISPVKLEPERDTGHRNLQEIADEIWLHYKQSVANILTVADICFEADSGLIIGQRKQLIAKLPFDEATFSKYVKIGKEILRFSNDRRKLLPASFSTIYEITCLGVADTEKAFTTGVIHPGLTREDLQSWKRTKRSKSEPEDMDCYARVDVTRDVTEEVKTKIFDALRAFENEPAVDVKWILEDKLNFARLRTMRRCMLISTRRVVGEVRKQHKRTHKSDWPSPSELQIDRNSTDDEIKNVLAIVGRQDEFQDIVELAWRGEVYGVSNRR
ncbi:MAG: hypothetical protein CTY31_06265 [Hyphomicrobium sp.]|nr:MAG: hypothetical protein CTY31_06265 [Hyphomicrobium sp.]